MSKYPAKWTQRYRKQQLRLHPELRPPKTKRRHVKNTKDYREFRLAVLDRDGFTCQGCQQTGGNLEVHHIKRKAKHPELACVVSNGVTLCFECHLELHPGNWGYIYKIS